MMRRAMVGHWVSAEPSPAPVVEDVASAPRAVATRDETLEAALAQAYEQGWTEGRAALAEDDSHRQAADRERIERAERSLDEARRALADLRDGLGDALARLAATTEASAVEIALAATMALVQPLVMDAGVVAAMCAKLVDDDGADASSVLEVSLPDRALLPDAIHGVRIVAVEGMRRGRCVLRSARGVVHGDVAERLQALVDAFRELADTPSP